MKQKDTPIQRKLMRVIMLTCGAVLLLTCAAFFTYEIITYRDSTKRELKTLGEIVAANTTGTLAFDDNAAADEVLNTLRVQKNVVAACLYDKNGNVFSTYPANLAAKEYPAALQSEGYEFKGSHLQGFQPVVQGTKRLGTLYLKSSLKELYNRLALYGVIGFVFILVSFLVAYLLSKRLQKTISNPILKLAKTARVVSDDRNYSVRATKYSNDELGKLTDAFNHMLIQIETQNAEIIGLNQNLEQKVSERTSELEGANTALKDQKEFIEAIIDSSIDLIAVFDKDLHFVILNKTADEIYQRDSREMIGKNLLEVFPSLEGTVMITNLQKSLTGEFIHDAAYKSLVSDRYFENFFIPLKGRENHLGQVLVIGHDITDIMLANEKLRVLNTELEKSNRDLEQFAYVASHDLQEPLRKIQTFSELSEKNIQYPAILEKYLQKITSSAARMTDLIKAVLNYSRLSKVDNAFIKVDLEVVINQIETDLELLIQEKGAVITSSPLPIITGIPLQISQLFLNLISNSLKFSDKPPRISITASIFAEDKVDSLPVKTIGAHLLLTFSDNGIGFDQHYAHQIFSIFQRLHSGQNYAGTGIGLALCKKIVENHGGAITVESTPGKGTTFFIYLPFSGSVNAVENGKKEIARQDGIDISVT